MQPNEADLARVEELAPKSLVEVFAAHRIAAEQAERKRIAERIPKSVESLIDSEDVFKSTAKKVIETIAKYIEANQL